MSDKTEMMQRIYSSFGTSSSSIPQNPLLTNHIPQLNPNLIRHQFSQFPHPLIVFPAPNGGDNGVPPSYPITTSPYTQIPITHQPNSQNFNHSRSMSQPSSFFSFDSLPPLSSSPFQNSLPFPATSTAKNTAARDVSMEVRDSNNGLPPLSNSVSSRKAHRRSMSEIPTGLNSMIAQKTPFQRSIPGGEFTDWSKTAPLVKREESICEKEKKSEKEAIDELFSAYMNLENIDALNSSEASDNKNKEEINKKENRVIETGNRKESVKRRAINGDLEAMSRHYRSVSVDSSTIQKLSFSNEFLKPPPSPGSSSRKTSSPTTSIDENSGTFSLKVKKTEFTPLMANEELTEMEFLSPGKLSRKASPTTSIDKKSRTFSDKTKKSEFTALEMKKIMANEKLSRLLVSDPALVKRIFDNRRSAARSKEKKTRYMFDLEHRVQTLQKEATTLSAQCTLMEREVMNLTDQNRDLNYRIQSMKKQEELQQALNDSLAAEVQRLKVVIGEGSYERFGAANESDRSQMQSLSAEMLQQLNINQLRYPWMQFQNQNRTMVTKPESN